MNKLKVSISIILSLLINFIVFYNVHKQKLELSQSVLKSGANAAGLTENNQLLKINLITAETKSKAENTNNQTEKTIAHKNVKYSKKIEFKKENHIASKKSTPTQIAAVASGKSSPKISQKARLQIAPPPITYPPGAIEQNAIGSVSLRAFIDIEGKISQVEIVASSGYKILDNAAIEWFHKLQFHPATDGEVAIGSYVTQNISFSLNNITDS